VTSIRDIEKKLAMLLPSDYSKDYRSFRPSNEKNMKQRLSWIRRWRRGKTSRHISKKEPASPIIECEAPDMSSNTVLAPSHDQPTINPALLHSSDQEMENSMKNDVNLLSPEAPTTSLEKGMDTITGEQTGECNTGNNIALINSESHPPQLIFTGSEHIAQSPVPQHLREIGRRLGGLRSGPYIKCINSLLRYSSTDSWRSSFSSLVSRLSSRKSRQSIERDNTSVMETVDKDTQMDETLYSPCKEFSREEQQILDELVNEAQFVEENITPLRPSSAFIENRPCCGLKYEARNLLLDSDTLCGVCGFSIEHLQPLLPPWPDSLSFGPVPENMKRSDIFGNTPLHFLAKSGSVCWKTVYSFVEKGAEPNSRNAAGETFMHILDVDEYLSSNGFEDYLKLVNYLLGRGFQFGAYDYHGNTARNNFIAGSDGRLSAQQKKILSLMTPTHAVEDLAIALQATQEFLWFHNPESNIRIASGLEEDIRAGRGCLFGTVLQHITWSVYEGRSDVVLIARYFPESAALIDSSGDTFLISVLKLFPNEGSDMDLRFHVMEVLNLGAEIHMRDRAGDSLLTIACCRGFRPVVKSLVSQGANVHARNLKGQGIISQCRQCLLRAQEASDDSLYAGILSCMNEVIDAGAKLNPTEIDEWILPPVAGYDELSRKVFRQHGYA
jgi:hypothetical protein